jgi:hypothetical protein
LKKKLVFALLAVLLAAIGVASSASAFEGGGRKPSEAPLIAYGQHYTGQLNNHQDDANYSGSDEVAIWRLPPVSTRDQIVVNWHVLPFTKRSSFPVCMMLVQGVDDFSWGTVFGSSGGSYCGGSAVHTVAGSGTAQTTITVQNTDTGSSYLEFFAAAEESNPTEYETYPYDFTVEAPRHFLGLAVKPKTKVHANGAISAAATLANGLPVPDGFPFALTVTWGDNGIATYAGASLGGVVTFPLALPESAVHERATFAVYRPADGAYQGVESDMKAQVIPAVATAAEIACARASQRVHVLARQFKRLKRNARFARGAGKRRLKHRARHVGKEWRAARSQAQAACG